MDTNPGSIPYLVIIGVITTVTMGSIAKSATVQRSVHRTPGWKLSRVDTICIALSLLCAALISLIVLPYSILVRDFATRPDMPAKITAISYTTVVAKSTTHYPLLTCTLSQNGVQRTAHVLDFKNDPNEDRHQVGQEISLKSSSDQSIFLLSNQNPFDVNYQLTWIYGLSIITLLLSAWALAQPHLIFAEGSGKAGVEGIFLNNKSADLERDIIENQKPRRAQAKD